MEARSSIQCSPRARSSWPDPGIRHGRRLWLIDLLGPRAVVGDCGQHGDTDDTNCDLHPDRVGDFDEHDVGTHREEDTNTEDFERLLAALDERPEYRPFEARLVTRHESVDEKGKNDEVDQPVGCEVGFVIEIERIVEP